MYLYPQNIIFGWASRVDVFRISVHLIQNFQYHTLFIIEITYELFKIGIYAIHLLYIINMIQQMYIYIIHK